MTKRLLIFEIQLISRIIHHNFTRDKKCSKFKGKIAVCLNGKCYLLSGYCSFDFFSRVLLKGFQYVVSILTFVNATFSDLPSQSFSLSCMFHKCVHVTFPASPLSQILHFALSYLFGYIPSRYLQVLTSINIISKHYFTVRCTTKHLLIFKI